MAHLFGLVREALILSAALSLPILAAAALVGVLTAVFQSVTSIQDAALAHLPKFLAIVLAVALTAPWIGRTLVAFATRAFGG